MYSPLVNRHQLQLANKIFQRQYPKHTLTYNSEDDVLNWREHLEKIRGKDGSFIRELTDEENRWITNERMVCKVNHLYALRRYCYINDRNKKISLFKPNLAQRIILDILGEMEEQGVELILQFVKARRLGVSTVFQLLLALRVLFQRNINAIIAASNPEDTDVLSRMSLLAIERFPYWMRPLSTHLKDTVGRFKQGLFYEFHFGASETAARNRIDLEHGTQFADIGRSQGPSAVHCTECAKYTNADSSIDAGLMKAMIPSPMNLACLEGTSEGPIGWWPEKYDFNKKNYGIPGSGARMRPTFLPWVTGIEIYPTETDLITKGWYEIHDTWQPSQKTIDHCRHLRQYVLADPMLKKHIAKGQDDWEVPREQQFFYEADIKEYRKKKKLHIWAREMACIAGISKIASEQGIVEIGQAKSIQRVETGTVSAWREVGLRQVMQMATRCGRELIATPDHPIATVDGQWVELQDLQPGQLIKLSPPIFAEEYFTAKWNWMPKVEVRTTIDEDWGRFLGYFMGDGCFSSRNTVAIACAKTDPDVIEDCAKTLTAVSGKPPYPEHRKGMVLWRTSDVKWNEIFQTLKIIEPVFHRNLDRDCGWKRTVCVPDAIFRSPRPVIRQFLSALFECDAYAHVGHAGIRLFSKDMVFLRDVQLLLLGFGVNSKCKIKIRHRKATASEPARDYTGGELTLNAEASDVFHREIGFIGRRKSSAPRRITSRTWGVNPNTMEDVVETVTPHGLAYVYDVTNPENHSFGANGILVHNSDDRSCWASGEKSVWDSDLLMQYRNSTAQPADHSATAKAVFGLKGTCGPDEIVPKRHHILGALHKEKSLRITADWTKRYAPFEFELYPVKFTGWNGFDETGKIIIFEWPKPGETYALAADNADGRGGDSSVLKVIRKGGMGRCDAEAASFASSGISGTELWPWTLALGTMYSVMRDGKLQQPIFIPEINREGGGQLVKEMDYRGWKNFYKERRGRATSRGKGTIMLGWHMNEQNRAELILRGIQAIEDEWIEINSPAVVDEMDVFIRHSNGRIAAAKWRHDDHIISMFLGFWALYHDQVRGTGPDPAVARTRPVASEALFPLAEEGIGSQISRHIDEMITERGWSLQ